MSNKGQKLMEKIKKERPTYTERTVLSRQMIAEEDPEYLELFHRMHMHVVHERNNLPVKFKEIIISAVDAATGYERGLRIHLAGALAAGATKEEIFEGLQAASIPGGVHVLSIALPILKEVLEGHGK
jgi:alkylhydroperoxidase/carboxymuconolactone decarboxylase family protein YurZ